MKERVVIVDDEPAIRALLSSHLSSLPLDCRTAKNAAEALLLAAEEPRPSLVLSDIEMPGLSGIELLGRLKALDETIQVVMVTGVAQIDTVRQCVRAGAYDYIVKPFEVDDLLVTVERAVERARLIRQNEEYRRDLERMVKEQTVEIRQTRDIALLTLARLAESRDSATGRHLERMAEYSRRLAQAASRESTPGAHLGKITGEFVEHLYKSSPLHDIGKVGIPDAILLKPGPLAPDEMTVMRRHPEIGGDTLRDVIERYDGHRFLRMGMEIAYCHHEHWDGSGYPRGLAGLDIPLAARIVALADAYDTITSRRPYKSAFDHEEAVRRIARDRGTHFDPVLVDVFLRCHREFAEIRGRLTDQAHGDPVRV
ncbi:MAG TPA: HD domain-containing phosphohydrolase [Thermoanaerobaculia bacterium]|jgi:putative two-component system response regulator|nr:HD domain-containing phosphohydrolase [Thermoanaerobaculia bacterium]